MTYGIATDGTNFQKIVDHFDRKLGDRTQLHGGTWGTIKVIVSTEAELNAAWAQVVAAIKAQNNRAKAARAKQQRVEDVQTWQRIAQTLTAGGSTLTHGEIMGSVKDLGLI